MGYRITLVTLNLGTELGEDFEGLWLVMLNPMIAPVDRLRPGDVPIDPATGAPETGAAMHATYAMIANLVHDWNLPDPLDPAGADAQPLPLPATAESVARLPASVIRLVTERVTAAVNPQ